MIKIMFSVLLAMVLGFSQATIALAQSPDTDPCASLKEEGVSPSLYGLCLAYQKAITEVLEGKTEGKAAQQLADLYINQSTESDPTFEDCPVFNKPLLLFQNDLFLSTWNEQPEPKPTISGRENSTCVIPDWNPDPDNVCDTADFSYTDLEGQQYRKVLIDRSVNIFELYGTKYASIEALFRIEDGWNVGIATIWRRITFDPDTGDVIIKNNVDIDHITPEQVDACRDLIYNTDLPVDLN